MTFRLEPQLPTNAYKTYQISAPKSTHYRAGTCEEAECQAYARGWITRVDEVTDIGAQQAYYIRKQSGRKFTEDRSPVGLTTFTFPVGQKCFSEHQVPLERDPFYIVRGGDWRGNPMQSAMRHNRPDDWVDDFANHQDKIKTILERG